MLGYIGYESEYDLGGINTLEDSSRGIVRSNLIHYIDAANVNSYPGTGTTALDISGQEFTGTLVGTISFNTGNKGFFDFTGATSTGLTLGTDFDSFSPTTTGGLYCDSATTFSVSVWYKWVLSPTAWGTTNHAQMFFGRGGGIGTAAQFGIFGSINTYNSGAGEAMIFGRAGCVLRGALTNISPIAVNDEVWHNSCITWDGTTARAYFDGLFYTNAFVGTANVQSVTNGAALGANAGNLNNNFRLEGSVSHSLVYNRALTDMEVLRNYDAVKERYGR
jgi:hypothetical protein